MKMLGVLVLVCAAGLAGAAEKPKENAAKKEVEKFQGIWKFTSLVYGGTKAPEKLFKVARLTITGDTFVMKDAFATYKGTFTLDPSQKPKTIDMKFTEGPEKGNTSVGIYEINGDKLKFCLSLTNKNRPTEFVSKEGTGHVLEELEREKK